MDLVVKYIFSTFVLYITIYNAKSENIYLKHSPARSCILPLGNSIVTGDIPSSSGLAYFYMHKKINLMGQTFHYLTVIEDAGHNKTGSVLWKCKCICGNIKVILGGSLISGRTQSCGCMKSYPNYGNRKTTAFDTSIKALFNATRQTARGKKAMQCCFKLSLKQFTEIILKNCNYCGIEPSKRYNVYITMTGNYRVGNRDWADSGWIKVNGIDRIDSKHGYTLENCVPCCKTCNFAKNDLTIDEFNAWIKRIINHNKNKIQ